MPGPVGALSPPPPHPVLITSARSCSAGTSPAQLGPILLSWEESCSAGTSPAQLGGVLLSWEDLQTVWLLPDCDTQDCSSQALQHPSARHRPRQLKAFKKG